LPMVELVEVSNYALKDVNLKIFDKELFVLLGRTGAGKTTLLNVISGLMDYEGTVKFDGESIDQIPTEKRGIGYLFQNLLLFPHMNVYSNISYSMKIKGATEAEIEAKVRKLTEIIGIEYLVHRYPKHLSGGEKQRVALARALASDPKILLLDEPFNNLDPRTGKHLRLELKRTQRQLGVTSIFVTHNLSEADELADRIGIMNDGRIQQVGLPYEIFFSPENAYVHDFVGAPNILECESHTPIGNDLAEVKANGISVIAPYEGEPIRKISIPPSEIFLSKYPIPGSHINVFEGEIIKIDSSNTVVQIAVAVKNHLYEIEAPAESCKSEGWKEGTKVFVKFRLRSIRTWPRPRASLVQNYWGLQLRV